MNFEETLKIPGYWDLFEHTGRQAFYHQGIYGQNTTVIVMDSGCNDHVEFEDRVICRYNAVDGSEEVYDHNGHGTAMAGVIAGKHGMMPLAKIVIVKIADENGNIYLHHIEAALEWAAAYRDPETGEPADIISISASAASGSKRLREGVQDCEDLDILIFSSAGNNGNGQTRYPANDPRVVATCAVDSYLELEDYSSYNQRMMFCMHGTQIMTADHKTRDGYKTSTGTSPATPMNAGTAGLMRSKYKFVHNRRMTNKETRDFMALSAIDLGAVGYDNKYGFGFPTLDPSAPREWTVVVPIGSCYIYDGGIATKIDQPAEIDPDTNRTMVPLRALAEALDKEVTWNAESRTAGFRPPKCTPATAKPLDVRR